MQRNTILCLDLGCLWLLSLRPLSELIMTPSISQKKLKLEDRALWINSASLETDREYDHTTRLVFFNTTCSLQKCFCIVGFNEFH